MKVGIVGPIWLNIPPKRYGGTEDVVHNLTNGLVEKGHQVTLFGPKTAIIKAKLFPTIEKPLREMEVEWSNMTYALYHITAAFDHAEEFDLLHVHLNKSPDYISLPLAIYSKTPVIFTLHFQLPSLKTRPDTYQLLHKYRELPFTTISNSQQKLMQLNYVSTIYNALDLSRFPYNDRQGNYLVWIGRITANKGTREAIMAAKKAGMKIYIMGTVDKSLPEVISYYNREIKPLINEKDVVWLGEVSHNEKASILSGALAMLNPIQWEEPFGLVMAAAQATGTPVISFRRGSAPEVIIDGKTGFLVDSIEEMAAKIPQAKQLSRKACREHAEEMFSVEKMIKGYEQAYEKVTEHWEKYKEKQKTEIKNVTPII